MPDEARERVFGREIPVRLIDSKSPASTAMRPQTLRPSAPETNATIAEGGLISDAAELEQQAAQSHLPDVGENLLKNS